MLNDDKDLTPSSGDGETNTGSESALQWEPVPEPQGDKPSNEQTKSNLPNISDGETGTGGDPVIQLEPVLEPQGDQRNSEQAKSNAPNASGSETDPGGDPIIQWESAPEPQGTATTNEQQKPDEPVKPKRQSKPKRTKQDEKRNVPGVLNMSDLARLPDQEWLVQGLLLRQGVSVLHGAPGTLKTFLALHLAGCCAYGLPFVPDGPKCRRGLVLYVAFEGLRAFKHRRRAWLRFKGLPEPDHDALKLINPHKQKLEGIDGIDFDFSSEAKVRNLIATGKRLSEMEKLPVVAVIVDVLKEALPNGIESVKTFLAAGKYGRLMSDELQCQVLILHHNTSNTENMRGPKNLEGDIETRIALKRDRMMLAATWKKNREGPTGFTLLLRAHKLTLGATKDEEEISSLAVETLGIDEDSSITEEVAGSKLRQIASEMGDEQMLIGPLLKRLDWSKDGRGGRQRQWVRDAIGGATEDKPRLVHLSGNTYKCIWLRRDGNSEFVCCKKLTAEEAKAEVEAQRLRLEELRDRLKGKKAPKDPQPQEPAT